MNEIKSIEYNEYTDGKIYRIDPINPSDIGDVYIGSTIKTLEKRLDGHCYDYKYFLGGKSCGLTSKHLFQKYGVENCKITHIESYPCKSRKQLCAKEALYINTIPCVNEQMKKNYVKKEIVLDFC
jgi:hypothetical protein